MRRTLALFAVLLPACPIDGRPDITTTGPGLTAGITSASSSGTDQADSSSTSQDSSSGEEGASTGSSTGASSGASTGSTGSTGDTGDTGDTGSTGSTGDTGTSTGGESSTGGEASSSTGEPEPPAAVCGDGVCEPAERSPCWSWTADDKWGPGFCAEDCMSDPACVAVLDCPCSPEAAAVFGWCDADPLPACGATAPGGACEVSDPLAFFMWNAKCGG